MTGVTIRVSPTPNTKSGGRIPVRYDAPSRIEIIISIPTASRAVPAVRGRRGPIRCMTRPIGGEPTRRRPLTGIVAAPAPVAEYPTTVWRWTMSMKNTPPKAA